MTVAFVLQGGGSLAAGQVGMLRALLEAGIRPDVVVGSSAGAINAVAFAQDPTASGLAELRRRWISVHRHDVFPLSPRPLLAGLSGRSDWLVSPRRLRAWIEEGLHIRQLGDAVIRVGVATTDAVTGQSVVLSAGPALEALLASTAIPGVFPPVRIAGQRLLDGGVAADIPLRQAEQLGATLSVLPRASAGPTPRTAGALSALLRAGNQLVTRSSDGVLAATRHDVRFLPVPTSPIVSPFDFRGAGPQIQQAYDSARSWLAVAAEPVTGLWIADLAGVALR